MSKGNITEKIIVVLVLLLLGFAGGTARLRPGIAAAPAETRAPAVTARPTEETSAPAETGKVTIPEATVPVATEEIAPTPTPTPEYYHLSFVGDCTFGSVTGLPGGYLSVVNGDFAYPFAKTVQYFADDDFTMANLECCLTEETVARVKTFVFRAPADYAKILTEGSVEFVTMANNHVLDYGQKGYDDTKAAVEAVGVTYAGRDEWALYETENGLVIGVYAVSSFGNQKEDAEAPELIKKGIAAVRAAGADFVIAALHFGDEGSYQVNEQQRTEANAVQKQQAHAAIDAGADFVYGSHSHTLQPMEVYEGKLIVYCMGNWTFGGNTNPRDKDTFILKMTVRRDATGAVEVEEYTIIPCSSSGSTSSNNYQPVPYAKEDEGYQRVMDKLGGDFKGANLQIGYGYTANE